MYEFETGAWTTVSDYQFDKESSVYNYDMIHIDHLSSYFVVAGQKGDKKLLTRIAMFKEGAWSDAGHVNAARSVSFLFLSQLIV